jgi:hypothetical protein
MFLRIWKLRSSTLRWARSMALGEHRVLDRVALLHAQRARSFMRRLAREHLHQVIVERHEEPRRTVVALAAGTPAELVVDAA